MRKWGGRRRRVQIDRALRGIMLAVLLVLLAAWFYKALAVKDSWMGRVREAAESERTAQALEDGRKWLARKMGTLLWRQVPVCRMQKEKDALSGAAGDGGRVREAEENEKEANRGMTESVGESGGRNDAPVWDGKAAEKAAVWLTEWLAERFPLWRLMAEKSEKQADRSDPDPSYAGYIAGQRYREEAGYLLMYGDENSLAGAWEHPAGQSGLSSQFGPGEQDIAGNDPAGGSGTSGETDGDNSQSAQSLQSGPGNQDMYGNDPSDGSDSPGETAGGESQPAEDGSDDPSVPGDADVRTGLVSSYMEEPAVRALTLGTPAYHIRDGLKVTGKGYILEQLMDYDFLMKNFYSVHSSTTAGREEMDAAILLGKDLSIEKSGSEPQILIYHTHSQETFADYGTDNKEATVVGIGNYLTELLQEKGYQVIHDTSEYDIMAGELDRNHAYNYALEGVTAILQQNPSIQVVLDVHRDGVSESLHMVYQIDGKPTAPIMFFNGMSQTPDGPIEYLPNPYREDNLAFSLQMQLDAAAYYPGLTRKIYLKGLRYNLHVRPRSALIEVGAQTNTYEEALNAMEPLAELLDMVLGG